MGQWSPGEMEGDASGSAGPDPAALTRYKTLDQAVKNALKQVEDMKYDAELMARGIPKERIRHYGLVFDGKRVLIGE